MKALHPLPIPAFLCCLLVDLLIYGALGRGFGLPPPLANGVSMTLGGAMALVLVRRRAAMTAWLLCVLWVVLAVLATGRLLAVSAAAGYAILPVKLLVALIFALLSPLVFRRILSGRDGWAVQLGAAAAGIVAFGLVWFLTPSPLSALRDIGNGDTGEGLQVLYATPPVAPEGPLRVYHLGHSLVSRDMPAMLAQLAEARHETGHRYESQLGWGTSLREHFEPTLTINGFAQENDHPRYRNAHEALASGDYDIFVMTEMVTLADAIRYHDSPDYAAKWAQAAQAGNPAIRVLIYETWHRTDETPDWLARLPDDLKNWRGHLQFPAARATGMPVHLVPAGQAMARLVTLAEASPEGIAGLGSRHDLFALSADGQRDPIHPGDLGNYLVALTHYAAIYRHSPVGLPHQLLRADGTPADAPSPELARLMQEIAWQVVRDTDDGGF